MPVTSTWLRQNGQKGSYVKNAVTTLIGLAPNTFTFGCTICNDREKLSGRVEVDEFFIGGKNPGKRGRGAGGKTIALVAVERNALQDPETLETYWQIGRVSLQVALDCSAYSLEAFINYNIVNGSTVVTDKLN
jgi:hypothetical protein